MPTAGRIRTRTQFIASGGDGVGADLLDNTSNQIQPLNMRDMITSMLGALPFTSVTTTYSQTIDDCVIYGGGTSSYVITLLPCSSMTGRVLYIKKNSSNLYTLTISPNVLNTIDGNVNLVMLNQYNSIAIHSDGSNWWIL